MHRICLTVYRKDFVQIVHNNKLPYLVYSRSEIFTLVKSLEDLGKYGRDFQALVRSKFSASQIGHVFKVLVIKLLGQIKSRTSSGIIVSVFFIRITKLL